MLQHFNNLKSDDEKTRLMAITCMAHDCRTKNSSSDTTTKYCIERLAKGMQSANSSTRIEFYAALVTVLKVHKKANLPFVIDCVERALTTKDGATKMERKLRQIARILASGAIIRAKVKGIGTDMSASVKLLDSLVAPAAKKKFYRSMATPFICQLLRLLPPGQLNEDFLSTLNQLLVKSERAKSNADYLKIMLTANHNGLLPNLGTIENAQELVDILIAGIYANDKETLDLVFFYIQQQGYFEEFWQLFVEQLGPYNSQLFCACVITSIKNGCPLKYLLTSKIILLLLTTLYNRDLGKEVKAEALLAFRSLLSWKVDNTSLSKKERKKALKRLYRGTPNLLHEYQTLVGTIKSHLLFLTAKELSLLFNILAESINLSENSVRVQLSALGLINYIVSQVKSASPELLIEITKFFFHHGFCKQIVEDAAQETQVPSTTTVTPKPDDEHATKKEAIQKQCVPYFLSSCRKFWNTDVITPLYDYIISVMDNTQGDYELKIPLTDKTTKLFSKARKILDKTIDPMLGQITRVGILQLLANQDAERASLESWLSVAKKAMKKDANLETMLYILDTVVQQDSSFFNYEAIFRRIVMQNDVPEEVIQALADAIDPGADDDEDEEIDFDDDEDDDDDSESENDEAQSSENVENDAQLFSYSNAVQAINGGGSDSEESMDIDEATEEDLQRMDTALANVFSTKKRIKEQSKQENHSYMKVLRLVDILIGRYKEPPISVVLMLLMPLVSSIKNSLSRQANQGTLNRTLATLKRLNKFKKFSGMQELDGEILSTMAQEIKQLIKKKLVPKPVKHVLSRSISNILCCA